MKLNDFPGHCRRPVEPDVEKGWRPRSRAVIWRCRGLTLSDPLWPSLTLVCGDYVLSWSGVDSMRPCCSFWVPVRAHFFTMPLSWGWIVGRFAGVFKPPATSPDLESIFPFTLHLSLLCPQVWTVGFWLDPLLDLSGTLIVYSLSFASTRFKSPICQHEAVFRAEGHLPQYHDQYHCWSWFLVCPLSSTLMLLFLTLTL
jgi:hypothetical protein